MQFLTYHTERCHNQAINSPPDMRSARSVFPSGNNSGYRLLIPVTPLTSRASPDLFTSLRGQSRRLTVDMRLNPAASASPRDRRSPALRPRFAAHGYSRVHYHSQTALRPPVLTTPSRAGEICRAEYLTTGGALQRGM